MDINNEGMMCEDDNMETLAPLEAPSFARPFESSSGLDPDSLIQQFNCMGTTDKDVLIMQLQKLIGPTLNHHAAYFFLDMNNWNLQRAVGSYFDLTPEGESGWVNYSMSLVDSEFSNEITVGPNTPFQVKWKLMNSGSESWPPGMYLKLTKNLSSANLTQAVMIQSGQGVEAGEVREVSFELVSPPEAGIFLINYQLTSPEGNCIGTPIHLILTVINPDETLDLSTQFEALRWTGATQNSALEQEQENEMS